MVADENRRALRDIFKPLHGYLHTGELQKPARPVLDSLRHKLIPLLDFTCLRKLFGAVYFREDSDQIAPKIDKPDNCTHRYGFSLIDCYP